MEFKDKLELNGFSLTSFPTDKFPVIPMDETMRLVEWGEDGLDFAELIDDADIPRESRADNGLIYYSEGMSINQTFDTPLLVTTHGIVTLDPGSDDGTEYMFIPFSDFKDVGIYTIQDSVQPLIRLEGGPQVIGISSSMLFDKSIVSADEIVCLHNSLNTFLSTAYKDDRFSVEIDLKNCIFLNTAKKEEKKEVKSQISPSESHSLSKDTAIWEIIQNEFNDSGEESISKKEFMGIILKKYPHIKKGTLSCQVSIQVINKRGRTGYYQCNKERVCGDDKFDFLFENDDIDHELYQKVLEQSALKDFIDSLPEGDQTIVGERGIKLSGGQRQRVGIARALAREAELIIFDEATSSLDSLSEHQIQDAIENSFTGHTLVIIAHRLSTIRHVDRIIVLDNGHLAEQGTFEELLDLDGLFAESWNMQAGKT